MFWFFTVSCTQTNTDTGELIDGNSWALEVCAEGQEEIQADYQLASVVVDGSDLLIEVGYSGGCGKHDWSLCWDENVSLQEHDGAELKHIELTLLHQTNDSCEMFKTEQLSFSLDVLGAEAHHITVGGFSVEYQP